MTKADPTKKATKPGRPAAAAPSGVALGAPTPSRGGRVLAPIPTPGMDQAQLTKAAAALAKHARASAADGLFADEDELVYLVSVTSVHGGTFSRRGEGVAGGRAGVGGGGGGG